MGCGCGNNNAATTNSYVCEYTKDIILEKLSIIESFVERAKDNYELYTQKNLSLSYVTYLINLYKSIGNVENLCIYRETLSNTDSFVNLMNQ